MYPNYSKQFDEQEHEMRTLHTRLKTFQEQDYTQGLACEDFPGNLNIES